MKIIIGVSFRQAGKVYFFDPGDEQIERGEHVIVETAKGVEYGTVVVPNREMAEEKIVAPLKKIIRVATPKDEDIELKNREKEKDAYKICLEKIAKHRLEMKLIAAEYTFDNNKLLFYFTADGRIDFRELVKDLATVFRTRIELRQIVVRDETKICGGIGICGRTLCCHSYLSEFAPVSIKMAKEQGLSLNPAKISGCCGRLMCCLKHEQNVYEELLKITPKLNAMVVLPDGKVGKVVESNTLTGDLKVQVPDNDVPVKCNRSEVKLAKKNHSRSEESKATKSKEE